MMLTKDNDTYRRWTDASVICYKRRCKCAGCRFEDICNKQNKEVIYGLLPMKVAVLYLFARHGAPKRREYGY